MKLQNFLRTHIKPFPVLLTFCVFMCFLRFPTTVYAGAITVSEEGTLFNESLSKAGHHTSSSWASAGSTSKTMGPYDLTTVVRMTTSASARTSSGDWQKSSVSATWYDANGQVITGLYGENNKVSDFATAYDLSSCTCKLYASGSTRNLWESELAFGYSYMYIGGTFTCTVLELKPKSPFFDTNNPGSNLTYIEG